MIELKFIDELIIRSALIDYKKGERKMLRLMKGYEASERIYISDLTRIRHLIKKLAL